MKEGELVLDCRDPNAALTHHQTPFEESHPTGHTLAIVNQKGGVGKSTTAVNLGASLAFLGRRVLLVDMDPQGNATSGAGLAKTGLVTTTYDVLVGGEPLDRAVHATPTPRLDIVPSEVRLAGAEVELVPQIARETKLRSALAGAAREDDFVLIDCPPSLGLLTINALAAAEACLIPMQCEYYALEGLTQLLDTIALIRQHLNPALRVGGVVLTMVDPRTKLSEQVAAEVRRHFTGLVFATEIPRSVRLAEAPSYGQPVLAYAPGSRGAEAYLHLARELLTRAGLAAEPEPPAAAAPEKAAAETSAATGAEPSAAAAPRDGAAEPGPEAMAALTVKASARGTDTDRG